MKQIFDEGLINTKGSGLYDFTDQIHYFVKKNKLINGILNINILHTSASLIIQENADPDVLHDLNNFFKKLVPMDNKLYKHTTEGKDDMPAHIKSGLLGTECSVPITAGCLQLGIWQGLYLGEHRNHAKSRILLVTLQGS